MLTETGRVVAIDGDAVWVETLRQSACGACSARSGCGHGLMNQALPGASRGLVRARPDEGLRGELAVHDEVELALPEGEFLSAAAATYLAPLAAALAGALLAQRFPGAGMQTASDAATALGALAGLAAGFLGLRLFSRRRAGAAAYVPVITSRRAAGPAN